MKISGNLQTISRRPAAIRLRELARGVRAFMVSVPHALDDVAAFGRTAAVFKIVERRLLSADLRLNEQLEEYRRDRISLQLKDLPRRSRYTLELSSIRAYSGACE